MTRRMTKEELTGAANRSSTTQSLTARVAPTAAIEAASEVELAQRLNQSWDAVSDALENTGASPATVDKAAGSLCAVLKEIDRRGPALSERVTAAAEEVSRILEGGYRKSPASGRQGFCTAMP